MNRALAAIVACSACCCNALLGIEEARVDPLLEASGHQASSDGGTRESRASRPEPSNAALTQPPAPEPEPAPAQPAGAAVTETPPDDPPEELTPSDQTGADDDADDNTGSGDAADDDAASESADDDVANDAVTTPSADAGANMAGAVDDAGAQALCDKYCEEIMEQCVGDMQQYRDLRQCSKVCKLFPEGELASDDNENTVACRLRYAANARYAAGTEQSAYCRQAGPGGDGRCGTNCEGYCTLMMQVCSAEVTDIYRYETVSECIDACSALPVSDEPYSSASLVVADGNHVQCRLFHVTSAAMLDAEEHCEHAIGITLCQPFDDTTE